MSPSRHSHPEEDGDTSASPRPRPASQAVPEARPQPRPRHIAPEPGTRALSVLFVCTGNIHRSPSAASCLVAVVQGDARIEVASAGTRGVVGAPTDPRSAAALRSLGVEPQPHEARRLQPKFVDDADLILAAEAAHVAAILAERPSALRRTFTLLEFVRLAEGVEPLAAGASVDELREQVRHVASRRGLARLPKGTEDIKDPVSADQRRTTAIARQVQECVNRAAEILGLGPRSG